MLSDELFFPSYMLPQQRKIVGMSSLFTVFLVNLRNQLLFFVGDWGGGEGWDISTVFYKLNFSVFSQQSFLKLMILPSLF